MINSLYQHYHEHLPARPKTKIDKTKLFRLDLAEGLFLPSPKVYKALKGIDGFLLSSLPDRGSHTLKEALSDFLKVKETYLSVFSGSDEIIEIIPRIFLNPEDYALVVAPTFQRMITTNFKVGADVYIVPTKVENSFCITDSEIELVKKLLTKKVKVVWVCSPNNPTGNVCDKKNLLRLIKLYPETLFVVNEVYQEYYSLDPKDSFVSHTTRLKNLVVIRSFSKAFGLAGVRVGYLVANPKLILLFENFRTMYNLSSISQELALAALKDVGYLKRVVNMVDKERKRVIKKVKAANPDIEIMCESKSNLLFLRHKKEDLYEALLKRGFVASDWRGAEGVEKGRFIRISIGDKTYNNRVIESLSSI